MSPERTSLFGKQVKIVLGIAALAGLVWFFSAIRGILAPFVLAFVLAYITSPLVDQMEGRGLNRTVSILLIFLAAFGVLGIGAFKAGGRVTEEITELSKDMLRKESVDRELLLTNVGEQEVALQLALSGEPGEPQPFSILSPAELKGAIAPGEKWGIQLRFAPNDSSLAPAVASLSLHFLDRTSSLEVELGGNGRWDEEQWEGGSGSEGGEEDALEKNGIVLSANRIDFGLAGPSIISQISESEIFQEIQPLIQQVQPLIQPLLGEEFDLAVFLKTQGRKLFDVRMLGGTSEVLGGVFSGLTFVVLVPFISFFFLKEGHRITRHLIELVPNAYFELCLNLLHKINGQIGGYIRGQLLATSVVATLSVTGLYIIDLKYYWGIGLLAGFANMIPFLGPLIGIISASIVALATVGGVGGMSLVGKVVVVFLIVQVVDNILVQPTVLAKSVEMHPLVVLFVVMVGSQLMGIVGMLIAVPLTGILKVSTQTIYQGVKGYRAQ
jgi:predicted PurR-regulated permease PerM